MDANYRFIYVDVGCNGRISDGGVFKNSTLFTAMENNTLNVPPPECLQNESFPLPYAIVSDDAFPLKTYIQKPFNQAGLTNKERRVFNYRLSCARRVVENSFGILTNRFRVFMAPISLNPEKIETIVMACCSLHNYLCSKNKSKSVYAPPGTLDSEDSETHTITYGDWRNQQQSQSMQPLQRQGGNRNTQSARDIRNYLTEYFSSNNGSVPWQDNVI